MSKELNDAFKALVDSQIDHMSICDFGEATVLNPVGPVIQIEANQGPLPVSAVMVPDYLKSFEVEVSGAANGKLTINNGLKKGDAVYYIRQTGAQKFLIIGRI